MNTIDFLRDLTLLTGIRNNKIIIITAHIMINALNFYYFSNNIQNLLTIQFSKYYLEHNKFGVHQFYSVNPSKYKIHSM